MSFVGDTIKAKVTWSWSTSSGSKNTTDRFLSSGGSFTDVSPFVSPFNAEIIAISLSSDDITDSWNGDIILNGGVTPILTLTATASDNEFNNSVTGVTFSAGSEIGFYCDGVSVDYPRLTIICREL
jgi:hypothetical protein